MNYSRRFLLALTCVGALKSIKSENLCNLTPFQPMGPFFKKNKFDNNPDMTNGGKAIGNIIEVQGKIMDRNCMPCAGCIINIWQANSFGKYNHINDYSQNKIDAHFNGYARIKSNYKGEYKFLTIIPGSYKISHNIVRPPHIHLLVIDKNKKKISTQLYFQNHPLNSKDFLFNKIKSKSAIELSLKETSSSNIRMAKLNLVL